MADKRQNHNVFLFFYVHHHQLINIRTWNSRVSCSNNVVSALLEESTAPENLSTEILLPFRASSSSPYNLYINSLNKFHTPSTFASSFAFPDSA